MRRIRAIMVAGQARLRPIIITALTTIIAMLPLALGEEQYVTRIAAPFAITVIGGLTLSTLFTLVFIPTVFSGLETAVEWFKNLPFSQKVMQIVFYITGLILIYFNIESWLWQFVFIFALLLIIPGLTFFVTHSLRTAQVDYISKNDSITIQINNVYKLYEMPGRFLKEWRRKMAQLSIVKNIPKRIIFLNDIWKFITLVFGIYFVYFYLESGFWIVVLMHFIYGLVLHLTTIFIVNDIKKGTIQNKWQKRIFKFLLWAIPLLNTTYIYLIMASPTAATFIFIVWMSLLVIYVAGEKLNRLKIDINKISGRFTRIRVLFYRFISIVPFIGKSKSTFMALQGVSLEIGSGMFGLLGPNGAGKTTLMRIICGVLDQNFGTIHINGYDVTEHREELQGLIGYLPQDFGMYENLTADEFLNYQAILKGLIDKDERKKRIDYVLDSVHLSGNRHIKIGSFSGGMKQRVGIAQTLLHLPRILVVDEPTAGLDPRERIRFRNLLVDLSRERVVIFSTHVIEDIASSCDRVAILNQGSLRYLGIPQKMAAEAEDKVWQCTVSEDVFEDIGKRYNVVHHTRLDSGIRIRVISEKKPIDYAVNVKPHFIAAYLWLLKNSNGKD